MCWELFSALAPTGKQNKTKAPLTQEKVWISCGSETHFSHLKSWEANGNCLAVRDLAESRMVVAEIRRCTCIQTCLSEISRNLENVGPLVFYRWACLYASRY